MAYLDSLYDELRRPLPAELDELVAKREQMRVRMHDGQPGPIDWELKSRYIADIDAAIALVTGSASRRRSQRRIAIPRIDRELLGALLPRGEEDCLDWKQDFPASLLAGSGSPSWGDEKGSLVKDVMAIANSLVDGPGFIVVGVKDRRVSREVVGVTKSWDDAVFQTWLQNAVDPPVEFLYGEVEWVTGVRVGLFAIVPGAGFPHVATQSLGAGIHEGQVWYRRGTKNTIALCADLKRMFVSEVPLARLYETLSDGALKNVEEHVRATGREPTYIRFDGRDGYLERGYEIAHHHLTGQEVHVGRSRTNPEMLMVLRPPAAQR